MDSEKTRLPGIDVLLDGLASGPISMLSVCVSALAGVFLVLYGQGLLDSAGPGLSSSSVGVTEEETVTLLLAVGVVTLACLRSFELYRQARQNRAVIDMVNHRLRNDLQVILLNLELMDGSDSQQDMVRIRQARDACGQSLKSLESITTRQ
jgi:signal transduction histidine kinase